jgi:hypothetical protein
MLTSPVPEPTGRDSGIGIARLSRLWPLAPARRASAQLRKVLGTKRDAIRLVVEEIVVGIRQRTVDRVVAKESERERVSLRSGFVDRRTAVQTAGVKDEYVSGLDFERQDVPGTRVERELGVDIGQSFEVRVGMEELGGIVWILVGCTIVELAEVRAAHESE